MHSKHGPHGSRGQGKKPSKHPRGLLLGPALTFCWVAVVRGFCLLQLPRLRVSSFLRFFEVLLRFLEFLEALPFHS